MNNKERIHDATMHLQDITKLKELFRNQLSHNSDTIVTRTIIRLVSR